MSRKRRFAFSPASTPYLRLVRVPRRFARAAVELAAHYHIAGQRQRYTAMIDNLGGGGVRLQTSEDLAAGTLISLSFVIGDVHVDASARVAMSLFDAGRERYVHGVAFTAIDATAQAAIVSHVQTLVDSAADDRDSNA